MKTQTTNTTTVNPSYEALKNFILNNNEKDAIACMKAMYDDFDFENLNNIDPRLTTIKDENNNVQKTIKLHMVFEVIKNGMIDLLNLIINHPNFDNHVIDLFGETILTSTYYYYKANKNIVYLDMIRMMIDNPNVDINYTNLNQDTIAHLIASNADLCVILDKLVNNPTCDLNQLNDLGYTPIGEAIRYKNVNAVVMLARRSDVIIRKDDVELAEKYNINFETLIGEYTLGAIPMSEKMLKRCKMFRESFVK